MNVELHKHLVLEQLTLGHEFRDDINRFLTANTIELHKMRMLELPVTRSTPRVTIERSQVRKRAR